MRAWLCSPASMPRLKMEITMAKILSTAVSGVALLSLAAFAQAAPVAPGAPDLFSGTVVYDPQGGRVGQIESVAAQTVVLDTGSSKATLPKTAFAMTVNGPIVAATKAEIDALVANAARESRAAVAAALVPGVEVRGKAGVLVGTVKNVEGDHVILNRTMGDPISLNKRVFTLNPYGLSISLTADELNVAGKAAAS